MHTDSALGKRNERGQYKIPDENKELVSFDHLAKMMEQNYRKGQVFGSGDSIVFEEAK